MQALADISRSALYAFTMYKLTYVYFVIATKPVHRLQIRQIVHNQWAPPTMPQSYIRIRAVAWECGEGQTHRRRWPIYISPRLCLTRNVTRHRASTSTRWHFAFGAMLS